MMYVINIINEYRDTKELLESMTRVVYSPTTILQDITTQVLTGGDIVPAEPVKNMYTRHHPHEITTDRGVLETIYHEMTPKIRSALWSHVDIVQSTEWSVTVKGASIILLTGSAIQHWESYYGNVHTAC